MNIIISHLLIFSAVLFVATTEATTKSYVFEEKIC